MAQDDTQLVVAEGGGTIYVAPLGSTPPANDSANWAAAWVDVGFTTEAGVKLTVTPSRTDYGAWQTPDPVRTVQNARVLMATFELEQFNVETLPLAFGGGEIQDLAGPEHFRYDIPDVGEADFRMLGIEAIDGDKVYRVIISKGEVYDPVETTFARALSLLPIGFKAYKLAGTPIAYFLTGDPAFATSGS